MMRRLLTPLLLLQPTVGLGQAAAPALDGAPVLDERSIAAAVAPSVVEVARTPSGAFTASLVLPGAGQAALGLRRSLVYAALEATFWTVHLDAAADVRRLTGAYRDLAWEAARLPTDPARRQAGSWGYYENLSQYLTSGAYDLDPQTPGVQPEADPGTYNGSVWELARGLFLRGGDADPSSPEYQDALAYYRDRAAGPDFLWSWAGRVDELERYRRLIRDADAEARVRSTTLGLVLANHLVSAVDALVVARLRAGTGVRLDSRLTSAPAMLRWHVGLRIPVPN